MLESANRMDAYNFFVDDKGHLRSGWRLAIFAVAFIISVQLSHALFIRTLALMLNRSNIAVGNSNWGVLAGHGSILFSALIVGWACGALLEELPIGSLGITPHQGWLKNFSIGSLLGAASLLLAAGVTAATRGVSFSFDVAGAGSISHTLGTSLLVFVFAAAAEELLFRGYPLQTLTRANLAWLGIFLTSVPFAAVHLNNPHAVPGFTFINTALAGVWLAVAYLRTRSLWLPLGLHWSWNWVQASVLGLPVSGIERLAPAPLLRAANAGPDWLTGGAYGIEGGAACTIALLISTLVIWRLKLFSRADVTEQVSEARP
ncbi:MAG TPA: CPBP family intramembrane glutamic endopeptidase [Pyrinomonadaceae bacterium]|nr:CPBP family intramembrane glutamic endopeptidase [Pyrinomonadaceae bacterium]